MLYQEIPHILPAWREVVEGEFSAVLPWDSGRSLAPPYSHVPPTPCHQNSLSCFVFSHFYDRKQLLCPLFFRTVNHPDIWERHPQMERWVGDNSSWAGSPPQPHKILLSHTRMHFRFLSSWGPGIKQEPEEIQGRAAQGLCVCVGLQGWLGPGPRTGSGLSAHCSVLQARFSVSQRVMALIVTVFPCRKLRRQTWVIYNEGTSRGRAKEVLGERKVVHEVSVGRNRSINLHH